MSTTSLEGAVSAVMETWPLQLAVTTPDGTRHQIALSADVVVVGAPGPGDLMPGMAVRVTATRVGGGLTAERVEVLGW